MKIAIHTLGCKVNQYESFKLIEALQARGHNAVAGFADDADYCVINTCAVTREAEKKSRQAAARARRISPNAKIFIVGCAAQSNKEQFPDYASVLRGTIKNDDAEIIEMLSGGNKSVQIVPPKRERVWIKVQDGCDNFCSYCIVPHLRLSSRSRPLADINAELAQLDPNEVSQVVFVGINLSMYGRDFNSSLIELVNGAQTPIKKRLTSLECRVIDRELLQAMKQNNFVPQFHLSLQSAADNVLKSMNRRYTAAEFMQKTELIRDVFPKAVLTADVIVGYPTETQADFEESLKNLQRIKFDKIHVFPFSSRPNTVAAALTPLPPSVVASRLAQLNEMQRQIKNKNF